MKKTIQTIALAVLCLRFRTNLYASITVFSLLTLIITLTANRVQGQETQQAEGITIGQQVPDVTINNIINYKTTSAKLSDFKGKLLILDFWATWCAPCIAMIPKMDSLQKVFDGKVQFLSVTYQDERTVKPFMDKLQNRNKTVYALTEVFNDKILHNLFPHTTLPHYVWIDAEGKLQATTGFEEVNADRIKAVLNQGNFTNLAVKKDVMLSYDKAKPLFFKDNGGELPDNSYHTLLSSFRNGLPSGFTVQKAGSDKGFRVTLRNTTLLWFYSIAYGEGKQYYGPKRIQLDIRDLSRIRFPENLPKTRENHLTWQEENTYCYEITLPPSIASDGFKFMQQDVDRLFPQYKVNIEKRDKTCLVLSVLPGGLKVNSTGGVSSSSFNAFGCKLQNVSLDLLFSRLNTNYFQNLPYPLVNESGYSGPADLQINAPLNDVDAVNQELDKYGLKFIEAERSIDMLVISDR